MELSSGEAEGRSALLELLIAHSMSGQGCLIDAEWDSRNRDLTDYHLGQWSPSAVGL